MMSTRLSLDTLKKQAKILRQNMADINQPISHSQSLEILAKQKGFKDWNTLHAHIGNQPTPSFEVGQRVSGTYLGQKFTGKLLNVSSIVNTKRYGISVKFDEPVDVITFKSMSNWRTQVKLIVDEDGKTKEKTSNGLPHMLIAPA
ncbi:MAG: hypothetical protein COB24_13610 [Hyphomicrobiales bacterium]|nr:MAG: hypothetical protein COB24_13610 [Hyphomicrobiales bacterium]